MPDNHPFVATLITSPSDPVLTPDLADKACRAINATSVYWLGDGIACDIPLPLPGETAAAREKLQDAIGSAPVDIVVQPAENRRKKLLIADMDSTMIQQECIDELAAEVNLRARVAEITRRAMNGEIAFEPALRERVSLLQGLPLAVVDSVIEKRITLMPGARALVQTMRANGAFTALVSGGFTLFTEKIAAMIGFDADSANILEHDGVRLTGLVREPILGKQAKLAKLLELCARLGISPAGAMAAGDGANDLAMLQHAGAGVALHARPAVAAAAPMRIDHGDLTALLYIQGYSKTEFIA